MSRMDKNLLNYLEYTDNADVFSCSHVFLVNRSDIDCITC
jgi:hypothetical protein